MSVPFRFRLEHFALGLVVALVRALPTDVAIRLSGLSWRVIAPWLKRHPRADRHLAAAMPELDAAERRRILNAMWRNLGMTFAEALLLDRLSAEPGRVGGTPASVERLTAAKQAASVVVSLHLGNWEALTILLTRLGVDTAGVYQRVRNPLVEADILAMRRAFYTGGLHPKGSQALKAMVRHIRAGGTVGVLSDLRDIRGLSVPFFGRMAPSTSLPAALARQNGTRIFAGWMKRSAPGRLTMHSEEIEVPKTDDREADILAATANIQACFERWIRANPDQWMWAHRRYER